jgi:hypothetical protein
VTKTPRRERRKKKAPPYLKTLKWCAAIGVVGVVGYGASQMAGVAYGEDAIRVVNFSDLKADEKRSALKRANEARCNCGCGMTLAQCVATDSTCPVRENNVERIKTMVREAGQH